MKASMDKVSLYQKESDDADVIKGTETSPDYPP